jgi:hypothetical protein
VQHMAKKAYQSQNFDWDALRKNIEVWFSKQSYQLQSNKKEKLKQLKQAFEQGFIDELAYNVKTIEIECQANAQK